MEIITEHHQGLRSMTPTPKFKRALLTGCGSKFGRVMLEILLEKYDAIDLLTSQPEENIRQSLLLFRIFPCFLS